MDEKLARDFKIVKNAPEKYWEEIIQRVVDDEGWYYSIYDYDTNKRGCDFTMYFAIENASDKVVGVVSLTKWPLLGQAEKRTLSIIGTFYVLPEYRNRKIGWWLFMEMIKDSSGDDFLTGEAAMWEKYRDRLGFNKFPQYCLLMLEANCSTLTPDNLRIDSSLNVCDWHDVELKKICAYDSKICACDRSAYLANTFAQPTSIAKVVLDERGDVVGVCRLRLVLNDKVEVGPLYADNEAIARSLLSACVKEFLEKFASQLRGESQFGLKIPSTNLAAVKIFEELSANSKYKKGICMIQYTKKVLEIPINLVYAFCEAASMTTV